MSGCKRITHTPGQPGLCFCRVTGDPPAFSEFGVRPCRSARSPLQRSGLWETRALSPTTFSSKLTWDLCPEAALKGTESRRHGDPGWGATVTAAVTQPSKSTCALRSVSGAGGSLECQMSTWGSSPDPPAHLTHLGR